MALAQLHGRSVELTTLVSRLAMAHAGRPQMVVMFGRRRVGKSFLLQHLGEQPDKSDIHAYYAATRESAAAQRQQLAQGLETSGAGPVNSESWDSLLDAVLNETREHSVTLLLDEVPYLMESDRSFGTVLQRFWDRVVHTGSAARLMIVLTGSAISTMSSVISSGGPLFERPTELLRLDPFDLPTAASFLGFPPAEQLIEIQAACGGYPLLLRRWDLAADTRTNLLRLAGDPTGALASNASVLLLDLPDSGGHHRTLAAIGRGATRHNEITSHAGQEIDRALSVLIRSGFVLRRVAVGERNAETHYQVGDGYLRFWFRIIERNLQYIEGGQGEAVIRRTEPAWKAHVADTFEHEARQHAIRLQRTGGLPDGIVGDWWTNRPRQAQVDVVITDGPQWTLAGEVKWTERFGVNDLRRFEQHLETASTRSAHAALAVWSKGEVDEAVKSLRPGIRIFRPSDLLT